MERMLKTISGTQPLLEYAADGNYRFCNGILYETGITGKPDAWLVENGTETPLSLLSCQFQNPQDAFSWAAGNGELFHVIMNRLKEEDHG